MVKDTVIGKFTNSFHIPIVPFPDGNGWHERLLVGLELMKNGYPPIDIKFTDRISYYNAFGGYLVGHDSGAMERSFAEYVDKRLDSYLAILIYVGMDHLDRS